VAQSWLMVTLLASIAMSTAHCVHQNLHNGQKHGVVGNASRMRWSYSSPFPVST